jgi:hypothetical protein
MSLNEAEADGWSVTSSFHHFGGHSSKGEQFDGIEQIGV